MTRISLAVLVVAGAVLFSLALSYSRRTTELDLAAPIIFTDVTYQPTKEPVRNDVSTPLASTSSYPIHTDITATVFWVGEPVGNGSSEDNSFSAWDDDWIERYGGYDNPYERVGYYPAGFTPKENPFYLDLPYNDFDTEGKRKVHAYAVVPWASTKTWATDESMLKNRWVKIWRNNNVCYGQIADAGPYEYNDYEYVFGEARPKNTIANNAGLDVSPALRDCLKFVGANNADNKVNWQFVEYADVPAGPWREIITTSHINWR